MDLQPARQLSLTLDTERLLLRAPREEDAARIAELANDIRVVRGTLHMPFPYAVEDAHTFITRSRENREAGASLSFSIEQRASKLVIGGIGLVLEPVHERAEMGYWLGVAYWNQGYASEAGRALLDYGFGVLGLYRIYAAHYTGNPASGRVMQKLGMTYEGTLRSQIIRFGERQDSAYYSLLLPEWEAARAGAIT